MMDKIIPGWTKEKPTTDGWYQFCHNESAGIRIGYVPIQDRIEYFQFGAVSFKLSDLNGWWFPATSPEWDGE